MSSQKYKIDKAEGKYKKFTVQLVHLYLKGNTMVPKRNDLLVGIGPYVTNKNERINTFFDILITKF